MTVTGWQGETDPLHTPSWSHFRTLNVGEAKPGRQPITA